MKIYLNSMVALIILIMSLSAPSSFGNTKLTPEDARRALARLHIPIDEQSYYNAIDNNDTAIVELFLQSGMSPNTIFSSMRNGITPLISAVYSNSNETAKLLIEYGADINYMYPIQDNEKRTALSIAIERLNYNMCKLLLEKGASTYFINNNNIYKSRDLMDKMIEKKEYISSTDERVAKLDEQAKNNALKISELLNKYADNDLITLTGKVSKGTKGWTFEPEDKISKTGGYGLGEKLPDMLENILEQAKSQNAMVTITAQPEKEGYMHINKIKLNDKVYLIPNYRASK
jgi:hypothetical protein